MDRYEDDRGPDGGAAAGMHGRGLWVEEPARRRRMPDPVRDAAVRAVLVVALTLIQATVTFFLALTASWLALPMTLGAVAGTIVATWAVLDVWITRQTWIQRYGVVSEPSSSARARHREARRAERAQRPARGERARRPARADRAQRPEREPGPVRIRREDARLAAPGRG
ncbi:hypothetical protein [Streptomyces sp. cmx-4-9]|uniref:hypothetical protein n=1 Tax=Streptomyces sp. cmx-4-9 TaxID=2790941 RepID=UPI003980DC06